MNPFIQSLIDSGEFTVFSDQTIGPNSNRRGLQVTQGKKQAAVRSTITGCKYGAYVRHLGSQLVMYDCDIINWQSGDQYGAGIVLGAGSEPSDLPSFIEKVFIDLGVQWVDYQTTNVDGITIDSAGAPLFLRDVEIVNVGDGGIDAKGPFYAKGLTIRGEPHRTLRFWHRGPYIIEDVNFENIKIWSKVSDLDLTFAGNTPILTDANFTSDSAVGANAIKYYPGSMLDGNFHPFYAEYVDDEPTSDPEPEPTPDPEPVPDDILAIRADIALVRADIERVLLMLGSMRMESDELKARIAQVLIE